MSSWWKDLRYGFRQLRLSPGFTSIAILTLALGIGANTAIFQLIDAIRLRSIPVKNPEELATVRIADRHWGSGQFSGPFSQLTFPMWEQIRDRQQGFSQIAVWGSDRFNLAPGGEIRYAKTLRVGGDFFQVLGTKPLLGRLLGPADDQPGCAIGGADISYAFWQRNFGGDPAIVGKRLSLDGNSFEIVGVTPPGFTGISVGDTFDVATPICIEPIMSPRNNRLTLRHAWWLASIGRLKPGWSVDRANAQIRAVTPAVLQETIPEVYDANATKKYLEYKLGVFSASTGFSELRQDSEKPLLLLLGISGLVLLIACANLANLMLARASAREQQITIRLALGATRGRMIRELLSESLLLAVVGSLCGLFLAFAISRMLVAFLSTANNQIFLDLGTDWRVLGFATALAVLTTVLFGLAPAFRATRVEPATLLQSGTRGMTGGRERFSLRRILVVSQVALSVVLLMGALLFARSLRNLTTLNIGFQQNGILVTSVNFKHVQLPEASYVEYRRLLVKAADPRGKRSRIHEPPGKPRTLYEIVGVTGDNKFQDMHEEYLPFMYFPTTQQENPRPDDQIIIRSSLPLGSLMASVKQVMNTVNPGIDLEFRVFKTQVHNSLVNDELMATLSGFFGVLAALLAAIGLYGVISYMVLQRTKEIGIRMAIGARRSDVVAMILKEAGILTVAGLVIGTTLALASAQVVKSLLYGLKPRDPLTLVLAVVTLAAVAAFASFLPAYRASRLDPLKALHYE